MSLVILPILGIVISLILAFWFYAKKLPRKEASEAFAFHILLWMFFTVISFVIPIMPANLIFGIFYGNPDGFVDGVHLGFSLLLWLPVINAALMLLFLPSLIKLKLRSKKIP
ncbi:MULTISPECIES: hypothetical protein [Deinococcus]|uniref:Uncharacterized protein n=1 Tax=Deinococcus sp. VB142 TaxID=3112952 RepID=A0AAU6PYP5_9DEIO|nr:hypothetical protein [Deinococcus wulumuqiensis]QII21203.1 hypothetical protein G6R31_10950 [Deinococcus wulumuqiensis R12]